MAARGRADLSLSLRGLWRLSLRLHSGTRSCLRRTGRNLTLPRNATLANDPLHFGKFTTLGFQTINNATRAAVDDDDPDHQQDDGQSQDNQAYDDQRVRR